MFKLFTEKDVNSKGFYADTQLREDLADALKSLPEEDRVFTAFAYTDYGGDWLDVVFTAYFEKNYPNNTLWEHTYYFGKNCVVFGPVAREFIEATEDYPLGFEDTEDFYSEMESEWWDRDMESFLDDLEKYDAYKMDREKVMEWLLENRGTGYYDITTQGIDFCSQVLADALENEGLIWKEEEKL